MLDEPKQSRMIRRVALVIVGLACAVIAAGYTVSLLRMPPPASGPVSPVAAAPVSAAHPTSLAATDVGTIPYYLQNDPRWGSETVGGSDESMAAVGCTVTCVAMGLTAIGEPTNPLEVCRKLKDREEELVSIAIRGIRTACNNRVCEL